MNEHKVLVCGSRTLDRTAFPLIREALTRAQANAGSGVNMILIHGGAEGADTLAAQAAKKLD